MAIPFRKTSKSVKRIRRANKKLSMPGMVVCPKCGELTLSHHVCSNCGYYKDKEVVEIKEKKEEK